MTAAEKAESEELLNLAPASFAEYITIYKSPLATSVESSDFNFAFAEQGSQTTFTPQSGRFLATVEYGENEGSQGMAYNPSDAPNVAPKGIARLSVSGAEAREFLKDAKLIQFDSTNFVVTSDLLYRGLFNRDVWTDVWVNKSDNATI